MGRVIRDSLSWGGGRQQASWSDATRIALSRSMRQGRQPVAIRSKLAAST